MNRYFAATLFLIIFGFSFQAHAQQAARTDSVAATAIRPHDLITPTAQWNTTSTDLFTYSLESGRYGFYGPRPSTFINGIPLDVSLFGSQNLNLLPVLMDDVSQTDAHFGAGIFGNTYVSAGRVDVKTVPVESGFSAMGNLYLGNESGDPGPYIYDSLRASPNIDRWGPDASFMLSYKNNGWYAKGSYTQRNHQQTDLIFSERIRITSSLLGTNTQFQNYRVESTTQSGLVETGYQTDRWHITARGFYGRDENYLFFQPYGREIPVDNRFGQLALDGSYKWQNWTLNGQYRFDYKSAGERYSLHSYIFDFETESHTVAASARYKTPALTAQPGIIYEANTRSFPGMVQPADDILTFYGDFDYQLLPNVRPQIHANVDVSNNEYAPTIEGGLPMPLTDRWQLRPSAFYAELLPQRQETYSRFTANGYSFGQFLGINNQQPLQEFTNETYGAAISSQLNIADKLNWQIEPEVIRHRQLSIPWQQVIENDFLGTEPGQFSNTLHKGSRFTLFTALSHHEGDAFRHELSLHLQYSVTGSQRYKRYFKQIPETTVGYTVRVLPVSSLQLSARAQYRSSTTWSEFAAIDGNTYDVSSGIPIRPFTDTYRTTTPEFVNISIGAKKWLWCRRLNVQLSVNNLLNQEVRYHTFGTELFTKFDISITASF